jgi:hypothetical protein
MAAAPDRVWVGVYQPEPDQNRQPLRNETGLKNIPRRNSSPITYFYLGPVVQLVAKLTMVIFNHWLKI